MVIKHSINSTKFAFIEDFKQLVLKIKVEIAFIRQQQVALQEALKTY
jgi:hypothetical protein